MCQPQPTHIWLFCTKNRVPSSLRSQPQSQSFNSKKHLCTYDSHLTKALLWTAVKIPQQPGNPDTGGLVLSPACHSCESRTHAGLGPNPHMQSMFSPQRTNTRSATKENKRKYRRRKPAHYFNDKYMFHQSLGKGTRFLFWVGIITAKKGPTLQVWAQKFPMHCPASTCRLLPLPRRAKTFKCLSTTSDREKNLSIYIQTKSWQLTSRRGSVKNTSNYLQQLLSKQLWPISVDRFIRQSLGQAHTLQPLVLSRNKGTMWSRICSLDILEGYPHPTTLFTVLQPLPQPSLSELKGRHQQQLRCHSLPLQPHASHFNPCFKLCRSLQLDIPFTCQWWAENFA